MSRLERKIGAGRSHCRYLFRINLTAGGRDLRVAGFRGSIRESMRHEVEQIARVFAKVRRGSAGTFSARG